MNEDMDQKEPKVVEQPPKEKPIIEFVSGLAQLGKERQGIGYNQYCADSNSTHPAAH